MYYLKDSPKKRIDLFLLVGLVHTRTKNKHGIQTIKEALTGIVSATDMDLLAMALEEAEFFHRQLTACKEKLIELCGRYYSRELELLQSVPGIKEQSAASILAEISTDMGTFSTASNLVKKRMNHNKALMANARKLLVVIWNILAKKQPYKAVAA